MAEEKAEKMGKMGEGGGKQPPAKAAHRVLIVDDDGEIVESVNLPWNSAAMRCWSPATAIRDWPWPNARIRTW